MDDITPIENNTARIITLFKTEDFPTGVRLVPGLNRVPNKYLEQLKAKETTTEVVKGKKAVVRFPGRELLKDLSETRVIIHDGLNGNARKGTQITIFTPDQVSDDREVGPEPPVTLDGYSETAALALIERVKVPKDTLKDWAKDKRLSVAAAAKAKLAGG